MPDCGSCIPSGLGEVADGQGDSARRYGLVRFGNRGARGNGPVGAVDALVGGMQLLTGNCIAARRADVTIIQIDDPALDRAAADRDLAVAAGFRAFTQCNGFRVDGTGVPAQGHATDGLRARAATEGDRVVGACVG